MLPPLTTKLIKALQPQHHDESGEKIQVNPIVSEVASFYENIRNSMEYQEEEVVFRAAIERILKRRLLLESRGEVIAEPLVIELAWAKYFPNSFLPKSIVDEIVKKINLYVRLYREVDKRHRISKDNLHSWILQLMSADIAFIIKPNQVTQIISNFMFHIFQSKITILDGDEEDKNALTFISVKRAFAKEDKAFLRYDLFLQYFDGFNEKNFENVVENFLTGYNKIEKTFKHPLNDQIYSYIKKRSVPFIILKDVFYEHQKNLYELVIDQHNLQKSVLTTCEKHYQDVGRKVKTAILRSVIFLFATKAIFALVIEGSFENFIFGHVIWSSLILNTLTPPFLMFLTIFFIRTPSRENSLKILERIKSILFDQEVSVIRPKVFKLHSQTHPILYATFIFLWIGALVLGILGLHFLLNLFKINLISQVIFIFFLVIISFLIFRISQSAKVYNVETEKEGFRTVFYDFFFMPFIHLGRRLTLSFSKINVFLIVFDFIIETPFKTLFAFFETWFSFLRSQRERLD